jgi:hypothetical protein
MNFNEREEELKALISEIPIVDGKPQASLAQKQKALNITEKYAHLMPRTDELEESRLLKEKDIDTINHWLAAITSVRIGQDYPSFPKINEQL